MGDGKAKYLQAIVDRAKIVNKYLKGREGVDIDPWEDPEFEVYHVTDRYGFIHNEPLSTATDTSELKTELERTQKWVKMLKNWSKYYPSEKLMRRIYKGIPDRLRGEVWSRILGVAKMKKEQSGVYAIMKKRAHEKSPFINQIDLDVNRTYRNHIMFRDRFGLKQQALFHILAAYSVYNTEVGYCQGMSEIAALLLMYLNEEDAFWALSQLLSDKRHAMHGFFIPGFPKLMRFQAHHENILKKFLPKVHKYMDRIDVYPALYAIKWFLQCFLDRTPFTMTLRLWDVYMLEGERLLVVMAYTIIKLHRRRLLKMQMEDLLAFFQETLERNFFLSDNAVLEQIQVSLDELRKAKMDVPPTGDVNELPTLPFGLELEPSIVQLTSKADRDTTEEHFRRNSQTSRTKSLTSYGGLGAALATHRDSLASVDSSAYETPGSGSRASITGQGTTGTFAPSSQTSIDNQSDLNASRQSSPLYQDADESSPLKSTRGSSPLKYVGNGTSSYRVPGNSSNLSPQRYSTQKSSTSHDEVVSVDLNRNTNNYEGYEDKGERSDQFMPQSKSDSRIAYNHNKNKTVIYVNGFDDETGTQTKKDDLPMTITHTYSRRKKVEQVQTPTTERRFDSTITERDRSLRDSYIGHNSSLTNVEYETSTSDNYSNQSPSSPTVFRYDQSSSDTKRQATQTQGSNAQKSPLTNVSDRPRPDPRESYSPTAQVAYKKPSTSTSDSFLSRKKHNDDIRDSYYRRLSSPQMVSKNNSPSHVKNTRNYRKTTANYASGVSSRDPHSPSHAAHSSTKSGSPSRNYRPPPATTTTIYDIGDKAIMRHTML